MRPQSLSWKCVIPARDLARRRAAAAGDNAAALCGRLEEARCRLFLEPEGADKLAALAEEALPVFHAAGDDLALTVANSASQRVVVLTT